MVGARQQAWRASAHSGLPKQQCSKTAAPRPWACPVMYSLRHACLETPTLHACQALIHSQEVHGKQGCLLAPRAGTNLPGQHSQKCIMEEAATRCHVRYGESTQLVLQAPPNTQEGPAALCAKLKACTRIHGVDSAARCARPRGSGPLCCCSQIVDSVKQVELAPAASATSTRQQQVLKNHLPLRLWSAVHNAGITHVQCGIHARPVWQWC